MKMMEHAGRGTGGRGWYRVAGAVLLATALVGCGTLGKRDGPPAMYDLGLAPATERAGSLPVRVDIRAPSWLAGAGMQYRLDYEQPAQRQIYAESRWVSPPAEMLERSLTQALSPGDSTGLSDACRLRIELDEFVQIFDAPDRSRAFLSVRTDLLAARGERVLARKRLTVSEPAPSADAAGGVLAFRTASARLASELSTWLAQPIPPRNDDARASTACGR